MMMILIMTMMMMMMMMMRLPEENADVGDVNDDGENDDDYDCLT